MFSYIAMRAIGNQNDVDLLLDGRPIFRIKKENPDLFDFDLQGEDRMKGSKFNITQQFLDALLWKRHNVSKATRRYQSPVLGRDTDFTSMLNSKYVRGFFQTKEYADVFQHDELKRFFNLREKSQKFINFEHDLENSSIIAVHVRRGDYRNHANQFGLLSLDYYKETLKKLQSNQTVTEVWIFSDEIEATMKLEESFKKIKFRYISKVDFSPAETLTLMSKSKNLVIANSTFSWWAGYLSEESCVYAPEKWFKENSSWLFPDNLLPASWQLVPSQWES
jgi:hypothetical protein